MRQSSRFIFHLKSGSSCTFPVQSSSALHFSVLSMLMKILLSRSHPSPDMPFRLIHIENLACFTGQGGIDLEEPFGHVLMYRTLADSKPLRRLPHRRAVLYNIICNLHGSLFNIIFQKIPLQTSFLQCMQGFLKSCPLTCAFYKYLSVSLSQSH